MLTAEKMTYAIMFFVVILAGCGADDQSAGVLDKDTFAKVYAALVENEKTLGPQTLYNIKRYDPDTTLARFGVTREQIENTIAYYDQDLRRWHEFYKVAIREIEGDPMKSLKPKSDEEGGAKSP